MVQERISPLEESIRDPFPRLRKQLTDEFEGQPEDLIDQAARHSLERYRSSPDALGSVRSGSSSSPRGQTRCAPRAAGAQLRACSS